MRTIKALVVAVLALGGASGCDVVFGIIPGDLDPRISVPAVIDKDTTWTADRIPVLENFVHVLSGVTLTIEGGTQIIAQKEGGLFIDRGARIVAKGTADAPIVFTSATKPGSIGDWRGVFLCGKAPINGAPGGDFMSDSLPTGSGYACGGDDPSDSSGEMHYVRIEFSGNNVGAKSSAAALELSGVGSGTSIDHVQIHRTNEDGFVIRGGAVSMKYLLVTDHQETGFDWSYGWQGKVQFLAVVRSDDGTEGGSDDGDSYNDNPLGKSPSNPTIYNATMIGVPDPSISTNSGVDVKYGVRGLFYNLLIADFNAYGLVVGDEVTKANAIAKTLDVRNSIFSNVLNFPTTPFPDGWTEQTWLITEDPTRKNRTVPTEKHGIRSLDAANIDLSLIPGAPGLSDAATPPDDGFFDPKATFIGACGETCPEFQGWTSFSYE